ncbi:MAG: acyl-CoA dehydratase activase-related protein, partial [Armatimonadota bacterium]
LEEGIDYLFLPGVINTEQPNPNYRNSQTCPYVQSAPEVIAAALDLSNRGVRLLSPRLFFKRGERHVRRVCRELAMALGRAPDEADRALDVAIAAQRRFREQVEARAREVYDGLGEDDLAFVVIGRPYTLYDRAVNMDIGKKTQDLGILAIPMDFIPLEEEDISDTWPAHFSRQIQKRLAAGRLIRRDPRLRAVVITYFGCGPDTFGNPFLRDELGEPCYVMQIDEHTADAGVITRIEAFADTVKAGKRGAAPAEFTVRDASLWRVRDKRIWIPYASEAAHVLAAAMRAYGIDARVLPRSEDPGLNLARGVITEDVCIPALFTTQDILERVQQPDFDPERECFFQGNSQGPCRFGMYFMLQRRILDDMGFAQVEMVTLGNRDDQGGLGTCFQMVVWDGLVAHDLLEKMLLRTRPYEVNEGECDAIFLKHLRRVCDYMKPHRDLLETVRGKVIAAFGKHVEPLKQILREAQAEFGAVAKAGERRPLVGLVGEFYGCTRRRTRTSSANWRRRARRSGWRR